jgi:hypothetical protein
MEDLLLCRFLDCAGVSDAVNADGTTGLGPASEKRQGTKSLRDSTV